MIEYTIIYNLHGMDHFNKVKINIHIKLSEGIDGFFCPEEPVLGPHGQKLAHPSFPHPTSCQKFITCYFGKDIKELGCMKGQVFDHESTRCKIPEEGPEDW